MPLVVGLLKTGSIDCPQYYYSEGGVNSCSQCPQHEYSKEGSNYCYSCIPGQRYDSDSDADNKRVNCEGELSDAVIVNVVVVVLG